MEPGYEAADQQVCGDGPHARAELDRTRAHTHSRARSRQSVLTGVVAHISVGGQPGYVEALLHGWVPLHAVLAVMEHVIHGGSRHVFDVHLTLRHTGARSGARYTHHTYHTHTVS